LKYLISILFLFLTIESLAQTTNIRSRRRETTSSAPPSQTTLDLVIAADDRDGMSQSYTYSDCEESNSGCDNMPYPSSLELLNYVSNYDFVGLKIVEIDDDNDDFWYYIHINYKAGFEFQLNIPQGSAIDTCEIGLYPASAISQPSTDTTYLYAYTSNAAAFNATHTHGLDAHQTITTSHVAWHMISMSVNTLYYSPNLSAIVQTAVSDGAWSSGNYIGIILAPSPGWAEIYYDPLEIRDYKYGNSNYYAKLHVVYH
jgi:hypothetical protein